MPARHFEEVTASGSTLKNRAVKSLDLSKRQIGEPVPLFQRPGGRFAPKNRPFLSRVEKVGLTSQCRLQKLSAHGLENTHFHIIAGIPKLVGENHADSDSR
jgi:hypothetical protein